MWKEGISVVLTLGALIGGFLVIDARYAKSEDVQKVEKRLDSKILSDQIFTAQERLWRFEDRYPTIRSDSSVHVNGSIPQEIREEYRNLEYEKNLLQEKLNSIK